VFAVTKPLPCLSQLTDDVKKEKEKEPEKTEKQETAVLRKKGFEDERKDSDDSDDVRILSFVMEMKTIHIIPSIHMCGF